MTMQYPVTWESLRNYHQQLPKEAINRTDEIEEAYQRHKKNHSYDLSKYLLDRFETGREQFGCPSWYKLVPCDFPYNLVDGVSHWLLWFNPAIDQSYTHHDVDEIVQNYLDNYRPLSKYSYYFYFENAPSNRSIQYIRHFHIFFR